MGDTRAPKLLLWAWTVLTVFFTLFTVWAFAVQLAHSNPLAPAFLCLLVAGASGFFLLMLRKDLAMSSPRFRIFAIGTAVGALPWAPFWAWVAQTDDAPGAMLLALAFLAMGILGLWAWWTTSRSSAVL